MRPDGHVWSCPCRACDAHWTELRQRRDEALAKAVA